MSTERRLVTAADMDAMTPQERADAVAAGVVRDLAELDPAFRDRVERRARELSAALGGDA